MTTPSPPRLILITALIAGAAAWAHYTQQDLVLSHYDAKAHLVVARRVIDNITPGWQQIGAVWLPLPHLVQLLPTQVDLFYRTGAFASLMSIVSLAVTAWAAARLVLLVTRSALGAYTAGALLVLNPNLLYLAATPMTEPMLLAVTSIMVLWLYEWLAGPAEAGDDEVAEPSIRLQPDCLQPVPPPAKLGWALFAAAWTRYEAWPIIATALAATTFVLWHRRMPPADTARVVARLAAWPVAAAALFVLNSRVTVGSWFVTGGFYVPDPGYEGLVGRSLIAVWWGTHRLSGYVIETVALATAAVVVARALRRPGASLVTVALFAAAALPFYAFYAGHPFRVRYMAPMVAACALFCGIAVGWVRRPVLLAAIVIASSLVESSPVGGTAPMLEEAQWDRPRSRERRAVTACLAPHYRGEKIMASMGSLAHYMQELARDGFDIADFLHEGNGVIWMLALETGPAPHAGWMLVEEQAEGGDILAQQIRKDATFARGMRRVCDGGGVALYVRTSRQP